MTTHRYAVDYYLGRGPEAQYLGSGRHDHGLFAGLPRFMSVGRDWHTKDDYLARVATVVDTTTWPHSHSDSIGTTWAVAYDTGSVYVYRHGVEMAVLRCNYRRWQPAHIAHPEEYPDGPSNQDEFVPRKSAKFPTFPPATDTEG